MDFRNTFIWFLKCVTILVATNSTALLTCQEIIVGQSVELLDGMWTCVEYVISVKVRKMLVEQ